MRIPVAILLLANAFPAFAADESGCDKLKWLIENDRAALAAPDRLSVNSGEALKPGIAATVVLRPVAEANLPNRPERTPAADRFAGYATFDAPASGPFILSLSSAAWVDVVQDGKYLRPVASSRANDCEGVQKALRFELGAAPFVIQVSGVAADRIHLILRRAN